MTRWSLISRDSGRELDAASVCATGNIPNVVLRKTDTVNVYELLRFKKLLFTKDALDAFIQRLA